MLGSAPRLFSVIQYLFTRADVWDTQLVLHWLTGSLSRVDWPTIRILSVLLLVLAPFLFWLVPVAAGWPSWGRTPPPDWGSPRGARTRCCFVAVLLVALGVAAAGPIAFVAFLAGPIARALNGAGPPSSAPAWSAP